VKIGVEIKIKTANASKYNIGFLLRLIKLFKVFGFIIRFVLLTILPDVSTNASLLFFKSFIHVVLTAQNVFPAISDPDTQFEFARM
jgi:hypothetical protein